MGLEIELEYDDTPDGVWAQDGDTELRERAGRRWSLRPSTASPLLVQAGIALTALVLGVASTAGLLHGRQAQRDRADTELHLAPVNPFVVQIIQQLTTAPAAELLATPWTNVFDQDVALSVVNDGPDPVTVLGATLAAPEFHETTLTPHNGAAIAPGGVSVLRGKAHFVCGDYPAALPGAQNNVSPELATTADIDVRTADGRVRHETLLVDRYSDIAEQSVCELMMGPQVVTDTTYTPTPGIAGGYKFSLTVANRASFPLRMTLPSSAVQDWATGGGLSIQAPSSVMIPPHGSSTVAIAVGVASCVPAMEVAQGGYSFDTLIFTDGRDAPDSLRSRQKTTDLFLADPDLIKQYCGVLQLPTVAGRSGH